MKKLKLVAGWRKCLTWWSVNIPLVNVAFITVWAQLPPKFQDSIPEKYVIMITALLIFFGVIGRMIDQGAKNADTISK